MSQPSLSKIQTLVTNDQPQIGKIVRMFRVTCGVCGEYHIGTSDSFEAFCMAIEDTFHLSMTHGWVHHKCQKRMPVTISR